ncbi:MAG: hypothetical protein J6R30_01690 [Bacteroidales bacterium]|nr:hypothetical protein [Bacteroidales bacterium]
MRMNQHFGILYVLLLICQIVLCNFSPLGPYIMLTVLPAMILCIPLKISTAACMLIAFGSGLAVDWLSEGIVGLNAASLIPVALARKPIARIFFGEDLLARKDSFSFNKYGAAKISAAILSVLTIFLAIYIFLDGAGTRPAWVNLAYFGASLVCNWILCLIVTNILTPDDRK